MKAVNNLMYLGQIDSKKASGAGFSLKFDVQKVKFLETRKNMLQFFF